MKNEIFLDTSFSIALAIESDKSHERAVELSVEIELSNAYILTTQAVILEIGNALSKLRYRKSAIGIIENLENDPNISVISFTDELYKIAFELFSNRTDKEWGLVDYISFIVMQERKITETLTAADEHFIQAGFRALLREKM